jgi:uncharacterized protein YpmS
LIQLLDDYFKNRGLGMSGKKPIIVFTILLILAGLACSLPGRAASTPTPVPTLIPTVDPQALADQLATASAEFDKTGLVNLTFSEQQITTFVAQALAKQPDIPFSEPQVSLQNGQITLNAKVVVGKISGKGTLVFEPLVEDGKMNISVLSAKFGAIPFPSSALEQITRTINQNISDYITVEGRSVQIESITIENGTMTVTGKAP